MPGDLKDFARVGRKIMCIGLNYKDHVAGMKYATPTKPIVFMKPTTSYIRAGQKIEFPFECKELFHEIEVGVVIGAKKATNIPKSHAMDIVGGYCLALDMTARDLQSDCKNKGLPWEIGKAFDTSCPVGDFIPAAQVPDPEKLELWCKVNDEERQRGYTKDLIFSIPHVIEYVTKYFTLEFGDVILTGSPYGVGPVQPGDEITGGLVDISSDHPVTLSEINFSVSRGSS